MTARVSRETEPTPMGDDPIEQVRAAWNETIAGLERNATITRADAAVNAALDTVNAHARLVVEHEAPRQQAVAKARAEREAADKAKREREAKAKAERVAKRLQGKKS